jgi:sporulation protein YlmC with PRC-barrel domain
MRRLFQTAAGVAVAVSASVASAQNVVRPPRNEAPQPAPAAQPQAQPRVQQRETQKVPEQAPVAQDNQQQDDGRSVRATQLIGMELYLEDGNSQGKINDLIIDNQSGQVAYMIVETDQDYRPVPWKAVVMQNDQQQNDDYFVLGMNRDKFMQSPAIPRQEWQTYSTAPAQWNTYWNTAQPRVNQFYTGVNTRVPANFNRVTNRQINAADRQIERGVRKANRKLD